MDSQGRFAFHSDLRHNENPQWILWLGTSDGLVRFDGINFTHQKFIVNSELMLGVVTALHGATDGSLWVGPLLGWLLRSLPVCESTALEVLLRRLSKHIHVMFG